MPNYPQWNGAGDDMGWGKALSDSWQSFKSPFVYAAQQQYIDMSRWLPPQPQQVTMPLQNGNMSAIPSWQVPQGPLNPIPMPPSLNIPKASYQSSSIPQGSLGGINPAFTPPKPTPKPIPVTKAYAYTVGGPEIVKPGYEMMSMQGQTGYYAPYKMTLPGGKEAWVLKYLRQPYAPAAKPPAPVTPPAGGGGYADNYSQGWGGGSYSYKQPKQKSTWYMELINWNFGGG